MEKNLSVFKAHFTVCSFVYLVQKLDYFIVVCSCKDLKMTDDDYTTLSVK